MFAKLRGNQLLLGIVLAGSLLSGCGKKDEDATPKEHSVQIKYRATNLRPSGSGTDVGLEVQAYFTDDKNNLKTGGLVHMLSGSDTESDETDPQKLTNTDYVNITLGFNNVDTPAKAANLPSSTAVVADIYVDGAVKKTLKLDKTSAFKSSDDYLLLEEKLKVGDLK